MEKEIERMNEKMSSEEKTEVEKSQEEKTMEEKTAEEKTTEEKTAEEKTAEEKTTEENKEGTLEKVKNGARLILNRVLDSVDEFNQTRLENNFLLI